MSDTDATTETEHTLRTPIVAVLGHVDHGRPNFLNRLCGGVRATARVPQEPPLGVGGAP